ncbi:hypothetical protein [Streptomyces abyssomicinicus]|uniref:hypothetical protein n=1 Tax=Streptomyces abyssomicinicus TaxID=574929 RepID=UPI00124FFE3D|nr:hypothetical protein [Streptomyces abyssomicinicus]
MSGARPPVGGARTPTAADLLAHEKDPGRYAGTEFDVRAVVPRLSADPADAPWGRFTGPHGPAVEVPGHLAGLASADPGVAGKALDALWDSLCHQGTVHASAALAAPHLLRLAALPRTHDRQGVLALVAACARGANVLSHTHDVLWLTEGARGAWAYDTGGYPANWSMEAVHTAVTARFHALEPLLDDGDHQVRLMAAYTLAMASGPAPAAALRRRVATEAVPLVAASLVLAAAQHAHRHGEDAAPWLDALHPDPARPAEVRIAAALARLCFGPARTAPEALRPVLAGLPDDAVPRSLDELPWLRHVGLAEGGLRHYVRHVLDPAYDPPPPPGDEPPF